MSDSLSSEVASSEIQRTVSEEEIQRTGSEEEIQRILLESIKRIDITSLLQINLDPRQIVEEFEKQLKYLSNGKRYSGADSSSEPRQLDLRFSCNVLETIWTAESIKGEGNSSILVTLFDSTTGEVVKFGPEASAKVEIVILKGSFETDDWTTEEFNGNMIMEMNGKRMLKGNTFLELKDGIGALVDLSIVHNEKWKRVNKLRLGARFMDNFQNIRVKEAKTKTFTMKDRRMKDNSKGVKVLSVTDNVWLLKNIGHRGPIVGRLTERGIITIKDFLSLYFVRPEELRRILGRGWSDKKLKATIDHALKCKNVENWYLASHPNSPENYGVVLTEVFNVSGIFKGSQFIPFDQLPETLKCDARNLVKSAFDNKEDEVVWAETMRPLVSPTCASNGPSSSHSLSSKSEDVSSEAADEASVLSGEEEGEVDTSPAISSNGWENEGRISSSEDHWDAMDKNENDANNILPIDMIHMNALSYILRVPSYNNEDQFYL